MLCVIAIWQGLWNDLNSLRDNFRDLPVCTALLGENFMDMVSLH